MTLAKSPNHDALSVLSALKAGNKRYVASLRTDKRHIVSPILTYQHKPCAIILGCSDARVPVELIFDQGLGDLFVIRVAGNVAAPSQIGSVEFAVEEFATKLVVVLGHSHCGAVTACTHALMYPKSPASNLCHSPNVQAIVDRIRPSVLETYKLAKANDGKADSQSVIAQAIRANVNLSVAELKSSPFLAQKVNLGELMIVGAHYDLKTGNVLFF